jgi:hypothetical protein
VIATGAITKVLVLDPDKYRKWGSSLTVVLLHSGSVTTPVDYLSLALPERPAFLSEIQKIPLGSSGYRRTIRGRFQAGDLFSLSSL